MNHSLYVGLPSRHRVRMANSKHRKKPNGPHLRQDLKRRELDVETLHGHLERVRESLGEEGYLDLKQAVDTLAFLNEEVDRKGMSLDKLRFVLFGPKTESTAAVCGEKDPAEGAGETSTGQRKKKNGAKAPGHGRNGASKYPGAKRVKVPLEGMNSGDPCPATGCDGKVYPQAEPATLVRVKAVAPIQATVYELARWRCNLCEQVFTAPAPTGVGATKYDESVAAMVGDLRYGTGVPHNRIERLQKIFGIPLPTSTQWELVLQAAGLLQPAFSEMLRQAAQGRLLHNDDTPMRILERASLVGKEGRKAIQTSAILSHVGPNRIALFLTGMNHAGENLAMVLKLRAEDLARPIQMCDALAANMVGEAGKLNTIVAHCLAHARRKFVEVETKFPAEVHLLLRFLRLIYKIDARAKGRRMEPDARLAYHQGRSGPLMEKLEAWLQRLVDGKQVEPNSGLGDAVDYLRNHWTELTLFLREPGAPLDNSACERVVKRAIMHRKNSLFYRTQQGARVGDTFMSLIHTAELNGAEPFDYLVTLLRNANEVRENPEGWMPWNFRERLSAETKSA